MATRTVSGARRAQAPVIVTRMGRDPGGGSGRRRRLEHDAVRQAPERGCPPPANSATRQPNHRAEITWNRNRVSLAQAGSGRDCEDDVECRATATRCGAPGRSARSRASACRCLRRAKGMRPAQPDAPAALDPTQAAGDDQRQLAGVLNGRRMGTGTGLTGSVIQGAGRLATQQLPVAGSALAERNQLVFESM